MTEKIPYLRYRVEFGHISKGPLEFTGKCKSVKTSTYSLDYVQCQRRIFGIPAGKFWVYKDNIEWREKERVEYYDCNCSG